MSSTAKNLLFIAAVAFAAAACTDDSTLMVSNNCADGEELSLSGTCVPEGSSPTNNGTNNGDGPSDDWADDDQDGVVDRFDNCPDAFNPTQEDTDRDGHGDACDNCYATANVDQTDSDGNGIGDICQEGYDGTQDRDGDGVVDLRDNCPDDANPDQDDFDRDGVGDTCDNCPFVANPGQQDSDNDTEGNACEDGPAGNICYSQTFRPDVTTIEPSLYLMLDASGSMANELDPNRPAPWPIDQAKDAIGIIADNLAGDAYLGLAQFPFQNMSGSTCTVREWLPAGMNSANELKNAALNIDAIGNTPTGYALNSVLDMGMLDDPNDPFDSRRPKAVVLITDGDPTVACASGTPDNRRVVAQPEAEAAAARLNAAGIPVYVVGFISGAQPANLDAIAAAGGTDAPGANRFYTANDAQQLATALDAITTSAVSCTYQLDMVPQDMDRVFVEVNGQSVSENMFNGFSFDPFARLITLNGDACDQVRSAADPSQVSIEVSITCTEPVTCQPQEEVCDYKDNDCDGEIDETCGMCRPEICDGVDNDCDDDIDEGCPTCQLAGDSCTTDNDCCMGSCTDGTCQNECRPLEVACTSSADCCSGACSGSVNSPGICILQ